LTKINGSDHAARHAVAED